MKIVCSNCWRDFEPGDWRIPYFSHNPHVQHLTCYDCSAVVVTEGMKKLGLLQAMREVDTGTLWRWVQSDPKHVTELRRGAAAQVLVERGEVKSR